MNKQRRKWLEKVVAILEDQKSEIENIHDEEEEAYDNLPEGLQESERGDDMYENCEMLDSAATYIDDALDELRGILDK